MIFCYHHLLYFYQRKVSSYPLNFGSRGWSGDLLLGGWVLRVGGEGRMFEVVRSFDQENSELTGSVTRR